MIVQDVGSESMWHVSPQLGSCCRKEVGDPVQDCKRCHHKSPACVAKMQLLWWRRWVLLGTMTFGSAFLTVCYVQPRVYKLCTGVVFPNRTLLSSSNTQIWGKLSKKQTMINLMATTVGQMDGDGPLLCRLLGGNVPWEDVQLTSLEASELPMLMLARELLWNLSCTFVNVLSPWCLYRSDCYSYKHLPSQANKAICAQTSICSPPFW